MKVILFSHSSGHSKAQERNNRNLKKEKVAKSKSDFIFIKSEHGPGTHSSGHSNARRKERIQILIKKKEQICLRRALKIILSELENSVEIDGEFSLSGK